MKSYRIFMTQPAVNDLRGISDYIANDLREPSLAKKLVGKIKEAVLSLGELPARHALTADENLAAQGIRWLTVDHYLIFYVVSEKKKTVTVIRILYAKRDWINLL
ncbi:addiction module RelE/StbE family toxin [Hydrogenispora ethanolica]|jgi:toxin ParE1/3/4|uniref:Addiction module RelE/StbE family toxin n=1 Tax=Hydrogenispora ethanolica TaxID=1082276 RepID=A0A4R1S4M4_HYDET|nr:type II toxin-antitoxin system RelE/ParE family toxin [Hydrogenispora ethanolica]TCL74161.1 addiction module RelE/StbE family toxin [Hydrogenispora ethanolica]